LGRNQERILVNREGIKYNYHYNYGSNDHGNIARKEQGCPSPVPYS